MAISDPIGDMLTRIRNAQMRRKSTVRVPASKLRERVLEVLKSEGYIRAYERFNLDDNKAEIEVSLKYHEGEPVIRTIARVSTPGRRVYSSVGELPRVASEGRHVRQPGPCGQCWRRSDLHGRLGRERKETERCLVSVKSQSASPAAST